MSDIPGEVDGFEILEVLQALASGVSIANAEGRIVFSNDAANRILGTLPSDEPAQGWADHYGVFVPDSDVPFPADRYPLVRALAGEEPRDVEMLIRNPALPHAVTIEASARPLTGPGGAITGAVVIFRDITALRVAQRALEQSNHELTETHRLKDELTAFVAHDLKGPLTTIMGLADLMLEDDLDTETLHADVADIRAAAIRMQRMVMDLLDLQLAEDGSLNLALERVPLGELAEEVRESVRTRAPGIVLQEMEKDFTVSADRSLLYRVIANLVDNCVKYGPSGGRITIRVSATRADQLHLCVEDEGPGVPEEFRESIFDKYAQVERSREERSADSRGLGLRFCRVIVEAHGGRIWVEDGEPTGARFCVELPILND